MKKILILFITLGILSACSSDDSPSIDFTSNLMIDGVVFKPKSITVANGPAMEHYSTLNFAFKSINSDYEFYVSLGVPLISSSISGTYDFGPVNTGERYANAGYIENGSVYSIIGHSVIIDHMGNNKYKITFVNSAITNLSGEVYKTISGSFEGDFTVVN